MAPGKDVPFVYCAFGAEALVQTTWSIRSLAQAGGRRVHAVVADERERRVLHRRLRRADLDLTSEVVSWPIAPPRPGYFFKPWALAGATGIDMDERFVYCDGDVLLRGDPAPVVAAAGDRAWFHKVDWNKVPEDQRFLADPEAAPRGTPWRAIAVLAARHGPMPRLHHLVNSGMFSLPPATARTVLDRWMERCFELDPRDLFGDQEVLTFVLHELGIDPFCDKEASYPMARHYLSDLKPQMTRDAVAAGLDPDRLRLRLLAVRARRAIRRIPLGFGA